MPSLKKEMFRGRGVLIDETLVISDLHYGYTSDGNGGMDSEYSTLNENILSLTREHEIDTLVVAGDIFHSFSNVPRDAQDFLTSLAQELHLDGVSIIVTEGNHDRISPETIPHVQSVSEYKIPETETVVLHGHEKPTETAEMYIVGHLHPMVTIQGQKWPAYLYAEDAYNDTDVLVLPAFSPLVKGTSIDAHHTTGLTMPVLTEGIEMNEYRPIVWDDNIQVPRIFPQFKDFNAHLG